MIPQQEWLISSLIILKRADGNDNKMTNILGKYDDIMTLLDIEKPDTKLCWIRPNKSMFSFIKFSLTLLDVTNITSVGCGTGLFELLLTYYTGKD